MAANAAPIALDDKLLQTGTSVNIAVLGNDMDPDGDRLTLMDAGSPANGIAVIVRNGTPQNPGDDYIRYTPDPGFSGTEVFVYEVGDGNGGSDTATVSVMQDGTMPVALADQASTDIDTAIAIAALSNDSDPNTLPLAIVGVSTPLNGSVVIDDNGTPTYGPDDFLTYTPNAGFVGSDSFSYSISNGHTSASASVNVTVGTAAVQTLGGHVVKGPVGGAAIALFRIDGSGHPIGAPVVETMTDANGHWSLNVVLPREPLLVVSTGGSYVDETDRAPDPSTRRVIALGSGDQLEGVLPPGEDYLALTLYTNALLEKSRLEVSADDFSATYAINRTRAAQAFGYDILTTRPANPAAPDPTAGVTSLQYAQMIGAAANVINNVTQRSGQAAVAFNVIDAFVRDFADCRLDGVDAGGPVQFLMLGVQRNMPTDLNLNLEALRFRNNSFRSFGAVLGQYDESLCSQTGAVADTVPPVITLQGINPVAVEGGLAYFDAGASASDDRDGDLTASILVSSTVDTGAVGSYAVTYTVRDAAGNPAAASRTVNVIDTTPPVIARLGADPVTVLLGALYDDSPGATASDQVDGDLTSAIVVNNPVDVDTPGTYVVTYDVTDSSGNVASQVTRTVVVVSTDAPVITLSGNSPQSVEAGSVYIDAGATGLDLADGDLTAAIVALSTVNTGVPGVYTVTYDLTDSGGNAASTVVRVVNVVDTTAPVVTLIGSNPQVIEAGAAYVELSATANDSLDGDLSAAIVSDSSAVDTSTPGSYVVTYSVSDGAGNAAVPAIRTVNVVDTAAPTITLLGADPQTVEANTAYVELGATATDSVDGDLTANVAIDTTGIDPTTPGSYVVTYNVSDAAGNAATQVIRSVNVVDTTPPVIALLGADPQVIETGNAYVELGASASDTLDGDLSAAITIDASAVNVTTPGSYLVTYDVSDAAGNSAATASRTVTVVDTGAPLITLIGPNPFTVEVLTAYVEPGATANDLVDGDVSASVVIDSSAVNTGAPGSYAVTYDVTDSQGNAATTVSRTVNVVDTTAPIITLSGANPQNIEAGSPYAELGASASDNLDDNISASIVVDSSAVNTGAPGSYAVTYDVTDSQGNAATTVSRTVNVVDTTAPIITLSGANPQTIEAGSPYAELGASASDNLDGDLSASIVIDASAVNTGVLGAYVVTYDVTDSQGNAAVTVNRTVNVVDTTAPVITLLGNDPDIVAEGSPPYADPFATALDAYDGDLTASIVGTGFVDTATAGDYTLYYDVADSSGNDANTVTRIVSVLPAAQVTDSDGDGLSDAIEQKITGSATASQSQTFFIDPDPSITVRDGTSWATAFGDIEDLVVANGGFIPQGTSSAQPTYVVIGDNGDYPATGVDPDRWRLTISNGNCNNIAVIGSMRSTTLYPGVGQNEPSSVLNRPNGRVLTANNCTNMRFYNVQFVDSGGPGVATGGAVSVTNVAGLLFDSVIFDGNQASVAGGAFHLGNSFTPTIFSGSTFRNNRVQGGGALGGGGIYLANNAAAEIVDSRLLDNSAQVGDGGAIYAVQNSALQITGAVISGNDANGNGGALFIERNNVSASSLMSHSLFSGNNAGAEGGAIYALCNGFAPPLRFFNNLIIGNAALRGGGVAIDDCDGIQFDNNTIAMNEARSAGGGGAVHIDTVSLAAPNFRPMPEIYDNVYYGNVDAGGASVYSINNLPSWSQQESHENLMDDAGSASTKDSVIADLALEFGAGWYLQPTSQGVDLSQVNASSANKYQAIPERTTAESGAVDGGKADAGYHYAAAYVGPATTASSDARLLGNAGTIRQDLRVTLLDSSGDRLTLGNRVALEIAPGSAPVNLNLVSTAAYPLDPPAATVAIDLGHGDYKLEVDTNGVVGPDVVYVDVYVDGLMIDQVAIPLDP